jgi:hypothetical protein
LAQEKDEYGRDLEQLTLKKRGPNKDHYGHIYLGYGFLGGESDDSAQIRSGKSSSFSLGYLWKWRLAKWYEVGFDLAYHYTSFHLKQDSTKKVPNRIIHRKEKLVFNSIQLSPMMRFKLRNAYHSNGTFIDLGGYVGYFYRVKNQTRERNHAPGAGSTRIVNLDLDYTRSYDYGLLARVGFNRIILYGRYRLSDLFTEASNLPELPRVEIGLKLGIHQ